MHVQVQLDWSATLKAGTAKTYTYNWAGKTPLVVGDRVELPPSKVDSRPRGTVVAITGDPGFTGPVKTIVAKLDPITGDAIPE